MGRLRAEVLAALRSQGNYMSERLQAKLLFFRIINAPPRRDTAPRARRQHSAIQTPPLRTPNAMAEVTDEQIREYVQRQGLLDALLQTQADLQQQLADAADLAQEMAALSFIADGPLHNGVSPCTNRKKRRGGSKSDENEGSSHPLRHSHRSARQGASPYSKRPTPLPQHAHQQRVPLCGAEQGGGLSARKVLQVLQVMKVSLVNIL